MAGSNIGGEWLLGPLVTAQYGGRAAAILLQVTCNLSVMHYAL